MSNIHHGLTAYDLSVLRVFNKEHVDGVFWNEDMQQSTSKLCERGLLDEERINDRLTIYTMTAAGHATVAGNDVRTGPS